MTDEGRCANCGHLNETCDLPMPGWPRADAAKALLSAGLDVDRLARAIAEAYQRLSEQDAKAASRDR